MPFVSPLSDFTVEHASAEALRLLFPLMQQAEPSLTLAAWLRYGRPLVKAGRGQTGILVARRRPHPQLSGAVCYRRERDLRFGLCLTAQHFIALDLLHPDRVLAALLAALDGLAAQLGCCALRSVVQGPGHDCLPGIQAAGHAADGLVLIKPVAHSSGPGLDLRLTRLRSPSATEASWVGPRPRGPAQALLLIARTRHCTQHLTEGPL